MLHIFKEFSNQSSCVCTGELKVRAWIASVANHFNSLSMSWMSWVLFGLLILGSCFGKKIFGNSLVCLSLGETVYGAQVQLLVWILLIFFLVEFTTWEQLADIGE